MGAAPSVIANHEKESATDTLGDEFPSGTSFYLTNGANDYTTCLAIDYNGQAKLKSIRDSTDRKWLIEYAGNDRTKIALRNVGTGTWLVLQTAAYGSLTRMHGAAVYWYAYKGAEPNAFWLSTTQSVDCFLYGAGYGKGEALFESKTAAMSWRLEWTPEYERSKAQTPEGKAAVEKRKAQLHEKPKGEDGVCCERCGEGCKVYQEAFAEVEQFKGQYGDCKAALEDVNTQKAAMQKDAEDQKSAQTALNSQVKTHAEREAEYQKRASALAGREKAAAERESALKQQEIDLQKRDHDLDARQQAVITDEKTSKATRVDKETARRQREEQAAHTQEVQRKTEETRKERQQEQAETAKLKAENVELTEKLRRLEEEAGKQSKQGGEGGEGASPGDFEKAKMHAELEHAREMIAELQQQSAQQPPQTSTSTSTSMHTPASARSYDFKIKPPLIKTPANHNVKGGPPGGYSIKPPVNKMPVFAIAMKVEPPRHTLPVKLASSTVRKEKLTSL
ncbi:hypothetical protein B0A55_07208 [Friedmanniomyces simplex]|uniref:Uncharacterized protein n=1 Tax=Friedmanniomyces simplex TaxID=329884 RepID=A0A4U0XK50_9PEZI|nr:hypothetical protein B0A55_07208 [Friedmanniomyces simplex]